MDLHLKIREYTAGDEEALVNIWNEFFRKDPWDR